MAFLDKIKQAASKVKTQTPAPQTATTNPITTTSATTSTATRTTTTSLSGNGNGAASLAFSNVFKYENSSLFDDDNKEQDACSVIKRLAQSSLYEGEGISDDLKRMAGGVNSVINNDKWKINMDADGDGTMEDVNLADAVAASYDSVLDLYIEEEVEKIISKYGKCSKKYLSEEALKELAMKGIRVDAVGSSEKITNRVYAFSLVDVEDDIQALIAKETKTPEEEKRIYDAVYATDAKVMKDSNGKKGSYLFADCLIPDGYAQGAERNLSSILDMMGYDCVSRADFVGKESDYFEMISQVENNLNNGMYHEMNKEQQATTINETYGYMRGIRESVTGLWGGNASAPGYNPIYAAGDTAYKMLEDSNEFAKDNDYNSENDDEDQKATKTAEAETQDSESDNQLSSAKLSSQKDRIIRYAREQLEKLQTDYLDDSGNLSKSNRLELASQITDAVNEEFNIDMTHTEIYDTIF